MTQPRILRFRSNLVHTLIAWQPVYYRRLRSILSGQGHSVKTSSSLSWNQCLWIDGDVKNFDRKLQNSRLCVYAEYKIGQNSSGGATQGAPGQMTWLEDPSPWFRPAYCFASVIVWTENKNVTISDHFICFILTVNNQRCWRHVFWGRRLKRWSTFLGKKCTPEKILATPMFSRRWASVSK